MSQAYYRAVFPENGKCECGLLTPHQTDVERVKVYEDGLAEVVYWSPLVNEPPVFYRSTEKVLCFSKTPGGAIIGSVTGERAFIGGDRCICETHGKPDIDISHVTVGDFEVLEEVRFKRPVKTKALGMFSVDQKMLKEIEAAYDTEYGFPNIPKLLKIRRTINRKLR